MLQVATFTLPTQQEEANEFLKTHKPDGPINFNRDMIVVFYDTGEITPGWEVSRWREYLAGSINKRMDIEIALHVVETDIEKALEQVRIATDERESLGTERESRDRVRELTSIIDSTSAQLKQMRDARESLLTNLTNLDLKEDYVKGRIEKLNNPE